MGSNEFEVELVAIVRRRAFRDLHHLRGPKSYFLRNLAEGTQEWVLQETKDILLICQELMKYNNASVNTTIVPMVRRVEEIRRTYVRRIISPMKKTGRKVGGDEASHWVSYRQAVEPCINLIIELLNMRQVLAATIGQAQAAQAGSGPQTPGVA